MKKISSLFATLALAAAGAACAQDYPSRPVTIIVPQAAGGANDILGRILAQELSKGLGQQFVVENRVGANGNIGTQAAAKAPRDGYTLLFTISAAHAVNPTLYAKVPFDPVKDFEPVMLVATVPFLLVVHPSVPANSTQELIALARARPGELAYGSSGNGATNHLLAEMLKAMAGIDMLHVPYKGVAAALTDMLGGRVQVAFASIPSVKSHVRNGKLRALGISTLKRSSVAPGVPPVADAVAGYNADFWVGLFTVAGTSSELIVKLHGAMVKALAGADVRERVAAQGAEVVGGTPEQLAAALKEDMVKWARVVKAARITID
ncbi:MAG: tripartite tricarboxylate transporter substrate binding protein [Betaproteobacteria bacterium]|nr:MAG: tripartite tricarboxylate transporter substrate binding protein [Betaproteobacteria bacterium]